jgi:hypothetical protein
MDANKSCLDTGFSKKHTAPAFAASARVLAFAWPAITIVGIAWPREAKRCMSSKPDMPGMLMSVIRQEVCDAWPLRRNSSAEEYAVAFRPKAISISLIASVTDTSSSTHAMNGISGIGFFIAINHNVPLYQRERQLT